MVCGFRKHAEETAAIHFRTIESLALAIEAKDQTTHDHLQRVRVYALGIGQELGMSEQAVKVAVHRLRRRYQELIRAEIAQTVATTEEIDDELRDLFNAVRAQKS